MRAVILGIGHWHALWYVRSLRKLGCEIAAVWDSDPERAETAGRSAGIPILDDYRDESLREKFDLAVVLPRPVEARAVMESVLQWRVPVIAEKPLGLNADDVRAVAESADARGSFVSTMFPNRMSTIWDLALDASAGRALAVHFRINNGPYQRYVTWGSPWMLDPSQAGGGVLRNLGIHGADAVCRLAADAEIEVVGATVSRADAAADIDTYAVALVRFRDAVAVIESGYIQADDDASDFECRIATEHRYLVDSGSEVKIGERGLTRTASTVPMSERYHATVEKALENWKSGAGPVASIWDCYRAARLVDAIYERASTDTAVGVDFGRTST